MSTCHPHTAPCDRHLCAICHCCPDCPDDCSCPGCTALDCGCPDYMEDA